MKREEKAERISQMGLMLVVGPLEDLAPTVRDELASLLAEMLLGAVRGRTGLLETEGTDETL